MLIQGKHAKVKLYSEAIRIFKTYSDSFYCYNELLTLNFLSSEKIMNLNAKKESDYTLSMDWLNNTYPLENINDQNFKITSKLATYLKALHCKSMKTLGHYLTHEDIFADNLLICKTTQDLYLIDWGLSKKRHTVYPDIASCAIGLFNENPELYKIFLTEYFESLNNIDLDVLEFYIKELAFDYRNIRIQNTIETESLDKRVEKAYKILDYLEQEKSDEQ